jgi:hypothetical protein
MSAIITSKIRKYAQIAYYDKLRSGENPIYMYFGKSSSWNESETYSKPIDNTYTQLSIANDVIFAKQINFNHITACCKRVDCISGVVYNQYDMYENIATKENYYVLTDDFNVYMCISNNNKSISLDKPTGTSVNNFETDDGYIWKYLYSISSNNAKLFLTNKLMPVQIYPTYTTSQYITEDNAIPGTIDSFVVTKEGQGYTIANVEISGDGTGAKAVPILKNGTISSIKVTDPGKNYTYANVNISGNGTGAECYANISPVQGHGGSILEELNASFIMIVALVGEDSDKELLSEFPKTFEFRKIGLINNLKKLSDNTNIADKLINFTYKFETDNIDNLNSGDIIKFNNGESATVVMAEEISDKYFIYVNEINKNINTDELSSFFLDRDNASTYIINKFISKPDVNFNNLNLLYLENLEQFTRNEENVDLIRIAIEF